MKPLSHQGCITYAIYTFTVYVDDCLLSLARWWWVRKRSGFGCAPTAFVRSPALSPLFDNLDPFTLNELISVQLRDGKRRVYSLILELVTKLRKLNLLDITQDLSDSRGHTSHYNKPIVAVVGRKVPLALPSSQITKEAVP